MTDVSTTPGGLPPSNEFTYISMTSVTFPIGTPVAPSTSVAEHVVPGRANSATTTHVVGLASGPGVAGSKVSVQYGDALTLTTLEWDAITGQTGGLTLDAPYFLSSATAGKLTTTAPSAGGTFSAPVGIALSSKTMLIQLTFPVAH